MLRESEHFFRFFLLPETGVHVRTPHNQTNVIRIFFARFSDGFQGRAPMRLRDRRSSTQLVHAAHQPTLGHPGPIKSVQKIPRGRTQDPEALVGLMAP